MTFTKKREGGSTPWTRPRPQRVPLGLVVWTALLAVIAIGGAAWALVRHYTHVPPPLLAPAPAPTYDADAGELPAPALEAPPRP